MILFISANLGTVHDEQQITTELDNEVVELTMRKSLTGAPSLEVLNMTELEELDDNCSNIDEEVDSSSERKDEHKDNSTKEKPHVHITVYF